MTLDYKAKLEEIDKLNANYLGIADLAKQQFESFNRERKGLLALTNE